MSGSGSIPAFISVNEIVPSEGPQERSSRPGPPGARVSHGGLCLPRPPLPPPPAPSPGISSRSAPSPPINRDLVPLGTRSPLPQTRGCVSCPPGPPEAAGTVPWTWQGQRDAPGRARRCSRNAGNRRSRERLPRELPQAGVGSTPGPCPSLGLLLNLFRVHQRYQRPGRAPPPHLHRSASRYAGCTKPYRERQPAPLECPVTPILPLSCLH